MNTIQPASDKESRLDGCRFDQRCQLSLNRDIVKMLPGVPWSVVQVVMTL